MAVKIFFIKKTIKSLFLYGLLLCGLVYVSLAQSSPIDQTFNPSVALESATVTSGELTIQPDGKILIYKVDSVNGSFNPSIVRLNDDGSLDESFACNSCDVFTSISNAVVQPDGKILVSGSFNGFPRVYRLNSNGSLENSYVSALNSNVSGATVTVNILDVTPDGKAYGIKYSSAPFVAIAEINRFNSDGSIDPTFTSLLFNLRGGQAFGHLKVLADGKVMIGGKYTYGYLFRVNPDGSKDTTFESPTLSYSLSQQLLPYVTSFDIQADGKINFVGLFTSVNGIERNGIARLNTNQGIDFTFNPSVTFPLVVFRNVQKIRVQPDQKLLIQGEFSNGILFRFNQDGTLDNSFTANFTGLTDWSLDNFGRIVYYGQLSGNPSQYGRLNLDGTVDTSFGIPTLAAVGSIKTLAIQSDQKIIASGNFTKINNTNSNKLARLNPNGTLDTSFSSGSGPNAEVSVITIQNDGKILIGGNLTSYNGTSIQNIARLNANGTLDTTFTSGFSGEVAAITLQNDGKILVGGSFTQANGELFNGIVRLNANGSIDNSFSVTLNSAVIRSIVVENDGKILIGGSFSGINGFARSNIARLNVDGSLDTSFNAGSIVPVLQIVRQPDGKYLIRSNVILRLNSNGSTDSSFLRPTFTNTNSTVILNKISLLNDGTIIVGGAFDKVNGNTRKNIVRLKPNGILDILYLASGTDGAVSDLALQSDARTLVGGSFRKIENQFRSGLARVNILPLASVTPFDFDGDGRADIGVVRPSNYFWYQILGANYNFNFAAYGLSGDILTPADYDGDGKTDISIFRPSTGQWVYGNQQFVVGWGQNGDTPLPSDVDGDGKADFVVFRPSTRTWYRLINGTANYTSVEFGAPGDKPVIGDFDGDGKADPAVFRPSSGEWYYAASSQGGVHLRAAQWGLAGDKLVPADYDGDGKTDAAIFRNGLWAIYNSSNGSNTILTFGQVGDKPVPADYDGDGKADVGAYRPSDGTWYLLRSSSGFAALNFGNATDLPIQSSFIQ